MWHNWGFIYSICDFSLENQLDLAYQKIEALQLENDRLMATQGTELQGKTATRTASPKKRASEESKAETQEMLRKMNNKFQYLEMSFSESIRTSSPRPLAELS